MIVKTSISLTDQQDAFARKLVEESRRLPCVSAVMQQGQDLLRTRSERDDLARETLRALLEQRRRGVSVPGEEMDRRIGRARKARRACHDL